MLSESYQKSFENKEREIKKKLDLDRDYKYRFITIGSDHVIEAHDAKTKKPVFRAVYDRIGIFDTYSGIWRWAWCDAMANKEVQTKSLRVKELAREIEKEYEEKYQKHKQEADKYHFYSHRGYFYTTKNVVPEIIAMAIDRMESEWFISIRTGIDDRMGDAKDKVSTIEFISIRRLIQISETDK